MHLYIEVLWQPISQCPGQAANALYNRSTAGNMQSNTTVRNYRSAPPVSPSPLLSWSSWNGHDHRFFGSTLSVDALPVLLKLLLLILHCLSLHSAVRLIGGLPKVSSITAHMREVLY